MKRNILFDLNYRPFFSRKNRLSRLAKLNGTLIRSLFLSLTFVILLDLTEAFDKKDHSRKAASSASKLDGKFFCF